MLAPQRQPASPHWQWLVKHCPCRVALLLAASSCMTVLPTRPGPTRLLSIFKLWPHQSLWDSGHHCLELAVNWQPVSCWPKWPPGWSSGPSRLFWSLQVLL